MKGEAKIMNTRPSGSPRLPRSEDLLRSAGLKVTAIRVALLDLVSARAQHFSADEITDALHQQGMPVDRVTIYRNIERMLREGLLLADLQPGRALRVALNAKPGKMHHHHIVCDACGKVTATESCYLTANWEQIRADIRRSTGYDLSGHLMQYLGTCPDCERAGS
jgi:Fur family ferric uptake transcriptional regulator